jgi:hypothetical protein
MKTGNARLKTIRNAVKRETGKFARLPKRMGTLLHAFCNDLERSSRLQDWKSGFFDNFLDEAQKKEMRKVGQRWTPLKGSFIPLESALAQLLLRVELEDFDDRIGPVYKEITKPCGAELESETL